MNIIYRLRRLFSLMVITGFFVFYSNIALSAMGPLIKVPGKHYFKNSATGSFVYLTGSHTWSNFQDYGKTDPPAAFDYDAHLNWLSGYGHNFIRLWVWEQVKGDQKHDDRWISPSAYKRTGPGNAIDGKPKFNLDKFNQAYFDRLRSRVIKAKNKGFYVSVMFFQGWSIDSSYSGDGNPWKAHPFNKNNNIRGINGDFYNGNGTGEEFHSILNSVILNYQKAFIRKVIDTVNDLENVIYEICNEDPGGNSFWAEKHRVWQVKLADYVKSYEATKPYQHPVGITATRKLGNSFAWNSNADWVSSAKTSTSCNDAYIINPPIPTHGKVDLLDTDHIFGIGGGRVWVWKSFMRGYNPIYMDDRKDTSNNRCGPYNMIDARNSMGYTLQYANRINLETVRPSTSISSTKYCLYDEGKEYLVYSTSGSPFTVNITKGSYDIEWFDPSDKSTSYGNATYHSSGLKSFTKPSHIKSDAVLYLKIKPTVSDTTTTSTSTSTNPTILTADHNSSSTVFAFEAEEGVINNSMVTGGDNNSSANSYIWAPNGTDGYAQYTFQVTSAGNYVVWGRVLAPNGDSNSFFVSMDGKADSLWDITPSNNWTWDKVNNRNGADPVVHSLSAGKHTLVIKQRENGAKLDGIVISKDMDTVPSTISTTTSASTGLIPPIPQQLRIKSNTLGHD